MRRLLPASLGRQLDAERAALDLFDAPPHWISCRSRLVVEFVDQRRDLGAGVLERLLDGSQPQPDPVSSSSIARSRGATDCSAACNCFSIAWYSGEERTAFSAAA